MYFRTHTECTQTEFKINESQKKIKIRQANLREKQNCGEKFVAKNKDILVLKAHEK